MYTLILITLINGGTSPPHIQEYRDLNRVRCEQMKNQKETAAKFGYCELQKK